MCFWSNCKMTFSNSLPVMGRRLIGRKFWGNFESLPVFGSVKIFASFQHCRKWNSWKQWLNEWVKCTNGRLGRYLRHSFGMSSIPQAILNFKEFINFCKSDGLIIWRGLLPPPAFHGFRHTNHVVWTEFPVSNCVGFLGPMKFKTWNTMNSSWCPWSIPLKEGFGDGPYSLRCDFSITYFCFPPLKCLFAGYSPDWFRDPVNCRCTRWIPGFLPQFS
jgi:hypothetical protein